MHSSLPLKKSEGRVCTMGCTMVSRDTSNVPRTRVEDENVLPTSGHFLSAPYAKVGSFIQRLQLRPTMAAASLVACTDTPHGQGAVGMIYTPQTHTGTPHS